MKFSALFTLTALAAASLQVLAAGPGEDNKRSDVGRKHGNGDDWPGRHNDDNGRPGQHHNHDDDDNHGRPGHPGGDDQDPGQWSPKYKALSYFTNTDFSYNSAFPNKYLGYRCFPKPETCAKICNETRGCNFVVVFKEKFSNKARECQPQWGWNCAFYSKCPDPVKAKGRWTIADRYKNKGGQNQGKGGLTKIYSSTGYCRVAPSGPKFPPKRT